MEDVELLNNGKGPFPHVIRLENGHRALNTELHRPSHLPASGSTMDQRHHLSPKCKSCSPRFLRHLPGVHSLQTVGFFFYVLPQSSSRHKINSTKTTPH